MGLHVYMYLYSVCSVHIFTLVTIVLFPSDCFAFCGQAGHISFDLPFTEFLPKVQRVSFSAEVSYSVRQF